MPIVRSNGIDMHYVERGQGGEPLILLMGLGADGSVWEEHVQAYERYFRCILVDNRGAGGSSKPEGPYTTEQMARDALGLMDALGIGRAHWSGISMGSAIAQHAALLAPERVQSLTLNCSWTACDNYASRIFETFRAAYPVLSAGDFAKWLQLIIFTPAYHERNLADLLERQRGAETNPAPMPAHAFAAQCDACISHRTTGRLGAIQAPTLITVGDRDLFTPRHLSEAILREIPHAEFEVFEGGGHTHHWDSLERFNRVTLDFMRRHGSQA